MYSNKGDVLFSLNDGKSSDHQKVADYIRFLTFLKAQKHYQVMPKEDLQDLMASIQMFKGTCSNHGWTLY